MSDSMSDAEFAWWFGAQDLPGESRRRLPPYLRGHRGHPAYRTPDARRITDNTGLSRTGRRKAA